eukprot:m.226034 g.226034  ORF g.226034 m.226034 type:complete len:609 (-) comp33479_c1_seq2:344-2170(-)
MASHQLRLTGVALSLFCGIIGCCLTTATQADPIPTELVTAKSGSQGGIWAVKFQSTQAAGNSGCTGGSKGEFASVDTLFETNRCTARHGASADRAYYKLILGNSGRTIESVAFDCTDSNCTDCYVKDTKFNECSSFTTDSGEVQSMSFRNSANFLPNDSSAAPSDGVTITTYNQCGLADELLLYTALGVLGNESGYCRSIGNGQYHSLYLNSDGKMIGDYMCTTSDCVEDECDIAFKEMELEESVANSEGCFSSYDSARFNMELGGQPPCQCKIDHVYVNIYKSDDENDLQCSFDRRFDTAIISRMTEGFSKFKHTPSGFIDIYRDLELEWNRDTSNMDIKAYGFGCNPTTKKCEETIKKPVWSKCYTTTKAQGSTAIYKPEHVCYGAPNVQRNVGEVAVYSFYGTSAGSCPGDLDADPTAVLQIRLYGEPNGKCDWDGLANNAYHGHYNLTQKKVNNIPYYSGGFRCNENCSNCTTKFEDWQGEQCYATSFGSIQIWPTDKVEDCHAPAPPPPGFSPTKAPNANGPDENLTSNSPVIVIVSCVSVAVFAAGVGAFVYTMRRRSTNKYESLVGRRSRSRSAGPRRGRTKNRGRETQTVYRDATYYDGI